MKNIFFVSALTVATAIAAHVSSAQDAEAESAPPETGTVQETAQERTVTGITKEITALENEARKIKRNPIIVYGTKQDGMTDERKGGTSTYNISTSKGSCRKKFRSKTVIYINPEYACPIHKCIIKDGVCPMTNGKDDDNSSSYGNRGNRGGMGGSFGNGMRGGGYGNGDCGGCKALDKLGTKNICNLGPEYDLSYRSWKLLKDKIPEGEAQEKRLEEIENQIKTLKAEIKEVQNRQREERRAKRERAAAEKTAKKK